MIVHRRELMQVHLVHAKQLEFLRSSSWITGFVAGRGGGKTYIGALNVLDRARAGEPWMSVSPTFSMVHETTLPTFLEASQTTGQYIRLVKSPIPRITFHTRDGGVADIVFRSGEEPERLRGPSKAGLWIDEASICKQGVFSIGIATLRYKGVMGPVVLTFTPRGRRHWTFTTFYQRVEVGAAGHYCEINGQLHWVGVDPATDEQSEPVPVAEFGGLRYVRTRNSQLIQAHTLDNPFLPAEFYANIRDQYSAQLAAQELAGEFVEIDGLMFRREWFDYVDDVPVEALRVRYWDRAATPRGGDYSAGVLMARTKTGQFYVEDVVRGQWSAFDRDRVIQRVAEADAKKYHNTVHIYIEQEGGSGGKEVAQQAVIQLARYPVHTDRVTGKRRISQDHEALPGEAKVVRALTLQSQSEHGNVHLKRADWNEDFLEELCAFPQLKHDDQVDAAAGGVNKLAALTGAVGASVTRTEVEAKKVASQKFGVHLDKSSRSRLRTRGHHHDDE